jgi:hypothetical protein
MFRFKIRDVLWLTVVVGMSVGWLVDRVSLNEQRGSLGGEQAAHKAKRRELDAQFLRLVDATDKLNQQHAQSEQQIQRLLQERSDKESRHPLYYPPDPNAL